MTRREFITLLGGAVTAWPLAARGQQPAMPVVGVLSSHSNTEWGPFVAAFQPGTKRDRLYWLTAKFSPSLEVIQLGTRSSGY